MSILQKDQWSNINDTHYEVNIPPYDTSREIRRGDPAQIYMFQVKYTKIYIAPKFNCFASPLSDFGIIYQYNSLFSRPCSYKLYSETVSLLDSIGNYFCILRFQTYCPETEVDKFAPIKQHFVMYIIDQQKLN
jgi:hypothetical protein